MTTRFLSPKILLICLTILGLRMSGLVLGAVPERPAGGVRDSAHLLSDKTVKTLERLIAEHQNLTQETILFMIWADLPEGGLAAANTEVFQEWKKETVKPPSVVLIGVDAKSGAFDIHVGIGLDTLLNPDEISRIRDQYFTPEYKEGAIDRPFYLSFLEVLRVLESPIVENGKAEAWIREAGFPGEFTPPRKKENGGWWISILLGVIGLCIVFFIVLSSEAHYTASGWGRVRRFPFLKRIFGKKKKLNGLITGGGVSGRW